MIIALDMSMLVYAGSGVARYSFDLASSLLKHHPEHTYKLFYSSRRRPDETKRMLSDLKAMGALIYSFPFPPWFLQLIWNKHHLLPISWLIGKYDVFHSSDYLRPPLLKSTKALTTIHDLTWKLFPSLHEIETVTKHERKLVKTIQYRDMVIVDSNNTKLDLLKCYPMFDSNQLAVIPLGVEEIFFPIPHDQIMPTLLKYQIRSDQQYILYVGAIEPRKRLELCVDVFSELIKHNNFSHFQFIIAGRAGWKNQQLFQKISRLGLTEQVRFIGYVADADLPALYTGASASLYLSSYEGFGLPPLESLACGTPVLASNNSSIKEFVPKRYLVDDDNPTNLTIKLIELMKIKANISIINCNLISWKQYSDKFIKQASLVITKNTI